MKNIIKRTITILVIISIFSCYNLTFAWEGDNGYDGGMSAADLFEEGEYKYEEVIFITGEPIILSGDLTIKRNEKQGVTLDTYTYKLENTEKDAQLTRVVFYKITEEEKANNQTIRQSEFVKKPTEVIKIGGTTYLLSDYDFTNSNIVDHKPAVDYYAGESWGNKTYKIGTSGSGGNISVEQTGYYYGYNQFWGSAQAGITNYVIQYNGTDDSWGGTATVNVSSTLTKEHKYHKNQPYQISFNGGYIETEQNSSIMDYNAKLPEFDKDGIATDYIKPYSNTLNIDSFPKQQRLIVPDLFHLNGHWSKDAVNILYSLEVLPGNSVAFKPQEYVTRKEFAYMIVEAAKAVPKPETTSRRTVTSRSKKTVEISPFIDVSTEDDYYNHIKEAAQRKLIYGVGEAKFAPNNYITVADTISIVIRALGLKNLAKSPYTVTQFKDNDEIPDYARTPVEVARRIGLIQPDEKGYIHPNDYITYEQMSLIMYDFIEYLSNEIVKDYRDNIISY